MRIFQYQSVLFRFGMLLALGYGFTTVVCTTLIESFVIWRLIIFRCSNYLHVHTNPFLHVQIFHYSTVCWLNKTLTNSAAVNIINIRNSLHFLNLNKLRIGGHPLKLQTIENYSSKIVYNLFICEWIIHDVYWQESKK